MSQPARAARAGRQPQHAGRAGTGPAPPALPGTSRNWQVLGVLTAFIVLGLIALGGWLAGWPPAVFGAKKAALAQSTPQAPATQPAQQAPSAVPSPTPAVASSSPLSGVSPTAPGPSTPAVAGTGPAATVTAYFAAITGKRYAAAWRLGGRNSGSSSYSAFVQGFNMTASDTVTILSVSGNTVTADLTADQTDGSVKYFQGTYTVTGGVITQFNVQQAG